MKKLFFSIVITLSSVVAFAHNAEKPLDDNTDKLNRAVKQLDASDWSSYTKAAELAINWNGDLDLAKDWLDKAMSIETNAQNLEVLGDYYAHKGETKKAFDTYMEALSKDVSKMDKDVRESLQRKVLVYSKYN